MLANLERLILDPISEDAANSPLEITGRDAGHGIYLTSHAYPRPERKTQYAASIDSVGERRASVGQKTNRRIPIVAWVAEEAGIAAATNLISNNPSIELASLAGYTNNTGATTIARATAERRMGEASLSIAVVAATANSGMRTISYAVAPSTTYYGLVWVKAPAGAPIFARLQELDAASASVGTTDVPITGTGDWQLYVVERAIGATGAFVRFFVLQSDTGTTRTFYADGFTLAAGVNPLVPFDGDTPGCMWTGTPHASTSARKAPVGKRFLQTQLDLESKIEKLAREGGTLLRVLPSGDEIRFDIEEALGPDPKTGRAINQARDEVSFELVCRPRGRGPEITGTDKVETTSPVVIQTETAGFVKGSDYARGRLVIDADTAADRRLVIWGVQSRYYDSSADAALFYEAESRTAMPGSATAVGTGSVSGGGSNTMRSGTLAGSYRSILSTQATGGGNHHRHVGVYRVIARCRDEGGAHEIAFQWAQGDFRRRRTNAPVRLPASAWAFADLGLVRLDKVRAGAQRWEGRILARTADGGASTNGVSVDWYALVPVTEGSGQIEVPNEDWSTADLVAFDDFQGAAGSLIGDTPPLVESGVWSEAGDADDFTIVTFSGGDIAPTYNVLKRTAVSDVDLNTGQYARLGTGVRAGTAISVRMYFSGSTAPAVGSLRRGCFIRYLDPSNWLMAAIEYTGASRWRLKVLKRVGGGAPTEIASTEGFSISTGYRTVTLSADTAGNVTASEGPSGATPAANHSLFVAADTNLATGGALDDGGYGIYDAYTSATAFERIYGEVSVSAPSQNAAIFASQSLAVWHDRVEREDSAGVLWAPFPTDGDYLSPPPAGLSKRTLRWIVLHSRGNFASGDPVAADDTSAQLFITPSYDTVPEPA